MDDFFELLRFVVRVVACVILVFVVVGVIGATFKSLGLS
jgi:hypothetical protein